MNRLTAVCLALLCMTAPFCSAADLFAGLEKGVRGVAWGEPLAAREDMAYNADGRYFVKEKEDLVFPVPKAEAVTLTRVWYYADPAGGFSSCIAFAPAESFDAVRSVVTGKFGAPKSAGGRVVLSVWKSGVVTLGTAFDGSTALTIKRPQSRVPQAQ